MVVDRNIPMNMNELKIVQRMYVKINPETGNIMTSCTLMEGYNAIYVSNYPGTQAGLKSDYDNK